MDFDQLETFLEVAAPEQLLARGGETLPHPARYLRPDPFPGRRGRRPAARPSGGKVSLTARRQRVSKIYARRRSQARRHIVDSSGRNGAGAARRDRGRRQRRRPACTSCPKCSPISNRHYPNVNVTISRAERSRTLEQVIDNSVDFGVVSLPVTDNRLTVVPIHRDELVLITEPSHPLARLQASPSPRSPSTHCCLPKVGRTREAIDNAFAGRRLKPLISHGAGFQRAAEAHLSPRAWGSALSPAPTCWRTPKPASWSAVPIADETIRRDWPWSSAKTKPSSRAALAFIDIAVKLRSRPRPAQKYRAGRSPRTSADNMLIFFFYSWNRCVGPFRGCFLTVFFRNFAQESPLTC